MMNYFVTRQNETNLILQSAGILEGFRTMSYEKLIMDFEIIDYVERFMEDVTLGEGRIPLDVMDEVGHEPLFLTEEHTFEFCRAETMIPNLAVRGTVDDRAGQFMKNIHKRFDKMMADYKKPERDEAVLAKLREILVKRGVEEGLLREIEAM